MSTFRVCSKVTGETVPQIIASGLTLEDARREARVQFNSSIVNFPSLEQRYNDDLYEARSYAADWGFSFYVEPEEPQEIAAVSQAFETLREILGLEGAEPETNRFLLSDIESDIKRILAGKMGIIAGEPWIAYS